MIHCLIEKISSVRLMVRLYLLHLKATQENRIKIL
jgi:hypothetical protein